MDRRRWYKLGLKQKKDKVSSAERKLNKQAKAEKLAAIASNLSLKENESQDIPDDISIESYESDDDADDADGAVDGGKLKGSSAHEDLFGYIDENGAIVYITYDQEMDVDHEEGTVSIPTPIGSAVVNSDDMEIASKKESSISTNSASARSPTVESAIGSPQVVKEDPGKTLVAENDLSCEEMATVPSSNKGASSSNLASFFSSQEQPCPRINPCLMMRLLLISLAFRSSHANKLKY